MNIKSLFKTKSIEEVCDFLKINADQTVKTLIVHGVDTDNEEGHILIAVAIRGDKNLNDIKAEKHPQIKAPLTLASEEEVQEAFRQYCRTRGRGTAELK